MDTREINDWAREKVHALLSRLICRAAEMLFWIDEMGDEE